MTEESIRLRFQRGDASADEIQLVVDEVLYGMGEPGTEDAGAAVAAGLDPAQLADTTIAVREGEQGAEPILTTILVSIAVKAGSAVAEDLWTKVVWPRVRRRLGATAVGEPVGESRDDARP